jgi:hypothetical protein
MADHFLDTETRHDIPRTAWCCVRAGLSTSEARRVWQYEVSLAVGFNAWNILGEWVGWDRDWLVQRIEFLRKRWNNRPGTCRWLRYKVRVHCMHGVWVSIGRCIDALLAVPSQQDRETMSKDLAFLARHYFGFCPVDFRSLEAAERERICLLYPQPFRRIMAPALVHGEALIANRRVQTALREESKP